MEDAAIVDLYWQRSDQAISETDRKYGKYCHTIAYNLCANNEDAEECVNDTWFSAWNLMPDKRPTILSTFLGYITRNFALDRFKAKNAQKRGGGETALVLDELHDCCTDPDTVEQQIDSRSLREAIAAFVETLKPEQQTIFIQRYWYVCPIEDIAEDLGISKSKVSVTLMRTRQKLRKHLEQEGFL